MPKQAVFEVRGPISRKLVDLRQEDMPRQIEGREYVVAVNGPFVVPSRTVKSF